MDEAVGEGAAGVEALAGHEQAPGLPLAEDGKHHDGDHGGYHPHAHLAERELGALGGDRHVAGGHEPDAAAERVAIDGADDRLRPLAQQPQQPHEGARAGSRQVAASGAQVGAGAEGAASAGQHHGPRRRVAHGARELAAQLLHQRGGEGVARFRSIEGDPDGAAARLDPNLAAHGASSGSSTTSTWSGSTICPTSTRTSRTTPGAWAARACSIFMASSTTSTSPAATR